MDQNLTEYRVPSLILPAGLILSVFLWALVYFEINWSANIVLFDLTVAMIFCWFISAASVGFGGIAGSLMASKPLVYCGKISYGIYVYHQFTPPILTLLSGRLGFFLSAARLAKPDPRRQPDHGFRIAITVPA